MTTRPDRSALAGRRVIVTGANSGLGKVAATAFADAGAEVVMACRSVERGEVARATVDPVVRGRLTVEQLDLADLASVRSFAAAQVDRPVDLLMNNAGLMLVPTRQLSADGFELQMGVNHLGHFALTRALWPALVAGRGRVVALTSIARRFAGPFDPGLGELGPYAAFHAYAQSKLACLLFARELNRRSHAAGAPVTVVAAHPGYCRTNLFSRQQHPSLSDRLTAIVTPFVGSSPRHGVRSQLRAATDPTLTGGELIGPRLWMRGAPVPEDPGPHTDAATAAMLWALSEEKTGAPFAL